LLSGLLTLLSCLLGLLGCLLGLLGRLRLASRWLVNFGPCARF